MFGELQTLGQVPAGTCAVLLALLVGCEISGRTSTSSQCDYVIHAVQDAPTPVFLGLCRERARALPDLHRLVADVPPAESLLERVQEVDLKGDIGPLAVFVAAGKPSTGRTKDGPSFCVLEQEDVRLLVLRATGCPGEAESRAILESASRVTHELSWTLLDATSEARFRDEMLRELDASGVDAEDIRLLAYSLGEPVP
jgi:hypothetical protein